MVIALEEELADDLSSSYNSLTSKLSALKNQAIDNNKNQIILLLENEIIKRYFYREGMYSYFLQNNKEVVKAKEILSQKQKYLTFLR